MLMIEERRPRELELKKDMLLNAMENYLRCARGYQYTPREKKNALIGLIYTARELEKEVEE